MRLSISEREEYLAASIFLDPNEHTSLFDSLSDYTVNISRVSIQHPFMYNYTYNNSLWQPHWPS